MRDFTSRNRILQTFYTRTRTGTAVSWQNNNIKLSNVKFIARSCERQQPCGNGQSHASNENKQAA